MRKPVSFKLPNELLDKLTALAEITGLKKTTIVERALTEFLQQSAKNPITKREGNHD